MKTLLRFGLILGLAIMLGIASTRPVSATEIVNDGIIPAGTVIDDDVLVTEEIVRVDGTVNGILFAAGDRVTINGTVNGDAFLFGSEIVVSPGARIDGNLFIGSRTALVEGQITGSYFGGSASTVISPQARIGRNSYQGSYSFETQAGSTVERDLYFGGYQAILAGSVGRDIGFSGAALDFSGSTGRNLHADIGSGGRTIATNLWGDIDLPPARDPGLYVDSNAVIGSQLIYTSREPQSSQILAEPQAGVIYMTPQPGEQQPATVVERRVTILQNPVVAWLSGVMRNTVTLLTIGALALWLVPFLFQRVVFQARSRPGTSAGYGVLTIFSGYFSILIAFVLIMLVGLLLTWLSLGGLSFPVFGIGFSSLALFTAVFTVLVTTGSKVVFSYMIGQVLLDRAAPNLHGHREILALITGVVLYALVRSIPIVGLALAIAATLIGVGAMLLAYQTSRSRGVVEPAAPA